MSLCRSGGERRPGKHRASLTWSATSSPQQQRTLHRPGQGRPATDDVSWAVRAGRKLCGEWSAAFACCVSSFWLRDVATDGLPRGKQDRLPLHNRFQHLLQIMLGRFRTLFPQIRVTIINATMVNQPAAGKENRPLRRDADLGETDQRLARIAQDLLREVIFLDVLADRVG